MLKKYLSIIRYRFQGAIEYRAETFLWIGIDLFPFFVIFFVWSTIYAGRETLSGYTLQQMIGYYLLIALVERLTTCHFEDFRSEQIRLGKIDYLLIRPFSYIGDIFSDALANKLFTQILFLPAFILVTVTVSWAMRSAILPGIGSIELLLFVLLIVGAFLAQFAFSLLIVLATFWMEGSNGLEHFKWFVLSLFSGSILPIAFMPDWLASIVNALPFKYMYAVPVGVLQQTYQVQAADLGYLLAFLGMLFISIKLIWRQALYTYTSTGG